MVSVLRCIFQNLPYATFVWENSYYLLDSTVYCLHTWLTFCSAFGCIICINIVCCQCGKICVMLILIFIKFISLLTYSMETVKVTPIAELRPYTKSDKIKIRVCRIWKSSTTATVCKYVTLRCILVDETNNAVEASASDIDCELVASNIDVDSCYEIMNFHMIKIRGQYKVVPHETQVIFIGTTVIKKLSIVFPPIPRHRFFLLDFNMLYPRLNRDDILMGNINTLGRKFSVCFSFVLCTKKKNCLLHCGQILQKLFVLYRSRSCLCQLLLCLQNIVLNSTGSSIFFIDTDIPFSTCKLPIKILPPSLRQANEAEILRTARRVTIDELAFLNPDLYKHLSNVLTHVMIGGTMLALAVSNKCIRTHRLDNSSVRNTPTKFQHHVNLILEDNTNEISALIIGKAREKLFGMPCKDLVMNQRLIDQQQLPNEFLRLIGQKKIFHLRFGNRKNSFNSSDVLIYNVSDDTAIEPITPQILPRALTISSTIVSSSTSPLETSEESHKRKREYVRKAFFTSSEQRNDRRKWEMASAVDPAGDPIPTSAVLTAAAKHIQFNCQAENVAFLKCKKKDPNPEKCLDKGRQVTRCVLTLLKDLHQRCTKEMDAYVGCMYYNTNELDLCRKEQDEFEKKCPLA
ncbi:hypothetical protein DVH24_037861 [Malus domestica]|uniref:Uncharacterized protein n=2 Tax=Malus domestica TaxID=3750 RepID=A0A498K3M3_MALDO|nr:hypothetical protein DVH24_037861 [Malus domestica]